MEITLKRIKLSDFRGLRSFEAEFGQKTVIAGDNATGKSTVFDAFLWCLFGKDSKDRKDYEIKPTVGGNTTKDRLTPSVTVYITVNGTMTVLKRELRELWVKHKGEENDTYEGNETVCYWNDSPIKVTEFKKRVADIVNEDLFKMLTNPFYFTSLNWKNQREALFSLVPAVTDDEVAEKDKAFRSLLDELSGKSLADFRNERNNALKELRKKNAEIQPRIDECRMSIKESEPREKVEAELAKQRELLEKVERAMLSASQAADLQNGRIRDKKREIANAQERADKIVFDAETERKRAIAEANRDRELLSDEVKKLEGRVANDERYLNQFNERTKTFEKDKDELEKEHYTLREEYKAVNEQAFDPSTAICPTCGQPLPDAKVKEAEEKFNVGKSEKIAGITKKGHDNKERVEAVRDEIIKRTIESKRLTEALGKLQKELEEKKSKLEETKVVDVPQVVPENVPGYKEAMAAVEVLREELGQIESQTDDGQRADLESQRQELKSSVDGLNSALAVIGNNERMLARINELEEEGRKLSQQIAQYERSIFVADKFEYAKVKDMESKVNGLFHNVKWKLFDKTIEGNVIETCVAVVGNALYPVANSAAKLNAGLDIIHILSEHHGVKCPIFVDNAEGVTNIDDYGMQLIELYVVKDMDLKVTCMN
jgi:DNA repair exonuclease SbcCD ATPase subunit